MKVDVNFNPQLPFQESAKAPAHLEAQIISEHEPLYYSSPKCEIMIQRLQLFERPFWYTIINATEDNLLFRFEVNPGVHKLLIYAIKNESEIVFLHQDVGVDIATGDYCYLGGGFKPKDLRVLLGKGSYETLTFPFSLEEDGEKDRMGGGETMFFINKFLFALGMLKPSSSQGSDPEGKK